MLALAPSVHVPTLEFGSCSPAHVAQAVEHFLGKEKVPGSNPGVGSKFGDSNAKPSTSQHSEPLRPEAIRSHMGMVGRTERMRINVFRQRSSTHGISSSNTSDSVASFAIANFTATSFTPR